MVVDPGESEYVRNMFPDVVSLNNRYLGQSAKIQMLGEMRRSFMYKSNRQSENELEPGEDSTRLHQNEQVEVGVLVCLFFLLQMEKFARDDRQKVTAASIYSRLGKDCVDSIYHVYFQFDKKRSGQQSVVLLNNGSHVCTCLLLQNNGIVCRHYFHLMQVNGHHQYHIGLIPKRWYREYIQDDIWLDISTEPFVSATHPSMDRNSDLPMRDGPDTMFMSDIGRVFPLPSPITQDDQTVLTLKWCHGEISGMMKDIVQLVEAQPEKFQALRDQIQQVIILGRGEVLDPEVCAKKGRPKTVRTRSILERKMGSTRCRSCKEGGHNARTCLIKNK